MIEMRKLRGVTLVGVGCALAAVGCGENTAPSESGVLQAVVRDDPTTRIAAMPGNGAVFAHHKESGSKYYHGTLTAEIQVLVSPDGVSWSALGGPGAASVALQDGEVETLVHQGGPVPSGTYRHARLVFEDASASLTAGSVFGGTELDSGAQFQVGDGSRAVLDLELPAPLDLAAGQTVTVVFDLNSEIWVSMEAVAEGQVDAEALAGAVSVGVRLPLGAMSFTL